VKICLACEARFSGETWQCSSCSFEPAQEAGHPVFAPELAEESEGFESEFFERLAGVERGHFWFEGRNRLLIWALQKYFPNASSLLEIGCGTGFVTAGLRNALPDVTFSASEIFNRGLEFARKRLPDVALLQMDARNIPFDAEFDVIGAFDVIEHIVEDEAVLAQMRTALKPQGGLILTVPQHRFLWSAVDERGHHQRRYERAELRDKLQRAGFEVRSLISYTSLLLPVMMLSRLRQQKHVVEDVELTPELNVPKRLNAALLAVLDVERYFISLGVRFPAGGSLLAVATKS
jgi:SAM-dependent methyltransferase